MELKNNEVSDHVIELTKMVRSLIHFISTEGKSCVDPKQMKLYVSTYLILFAKVMNHSAEPLDQSKIKQQILEDTEWLKMNI